MRSPSLARLPDLAAHGLPRVAHALALVGLGLAQLADVGRDLADLLGIPGWEVFQPWALITLAAGGSLLVPVWQRLSGSLPVAAGIALLTTAIAISTTADEPYAAVVAMGLPPLAVMARRALAGAWSATVGVIVFLGLSATFYTLHTAVGALIVSTLTIAVCAAERSGRPTCGPR